MTGKMGGPYAYITENEITRLVEMGHLGDHGLKKLAHRRLNNSFRGLFGGCPRGINGNTPAELLHLVQLGLHQYLIEQFFDMKKLTWDAVKKEHLSLKNNSHVTNYLDSFFDKNDVRVIPETGDIPTLIDELAKKIGEIMKRQSDKDMPRIYFSQGITCLRDSKNKMSAHEMQGVLILLLLMLCSTGGSDLFYTYNEKKGVQKNRGMGQTRAAQWIKLIERCICLEELMKSTTGISQADMKKIQTFIPAFLHQDYLPTINRTNGMGSNCVKFHLLKHYAEDNVRFGLGANYCSGPGESMHKENVKKPSKRTQRRTSVFDQQSAKRIVEQVVIKRAMKKYSPSKKVDLVSHDCPEMTGYNFGVFSSTTGFQLKSNWKETFFEQENITNWMKQFICPYSESEEIQCFTEFKAGDTLYRANPCYYLGAQHDWALIDWGERIGWVPAQIILFIDVPEWKEVPFQVNQSFVSTGGQFAIIESLTTKLSLEEKYMSHQQSRLVHYGIKEKGKYNLVDTTRIMGPAIAIPDLIYQPAVNRSGHVPIPSKFEFSNENYLCLRPRKEWADEFILTAKSF